MEHKQIEETNLIDRYVRGTMPADLREAFEEHFLDCPECLHQLELASSLREGLRLSAADLTASANTSRVRSGSWFAWRWAPIAAAACLVLAAIPSVILFRELGSVTSELNKDRAALGAARTMIAGVERAGASVYVLNPVRGAALPAKVVVGTAPAWTVLTLESDFTRFAVYRATVRNGQDSVVWQKDQLQPSSPDAIGVVLPADLSLAPGAYKVVLEGEDQPGRYIPVATFSFQVSRTP
jgi:hypothetical protein